MALISAPLVQSAFVQRLPNLQCARGPDGPVRLVKGKTGIVPIQVAEFQKLSGHSLLFIDQFFVVEIKDSLRCYAMPMRHEAAIGRIVDSKFNEIIGEPLRRIK